MLAMDRDNTERTTRLSMHRRTAQMEAIATNLPFNERVGILQLNILKVEEGGWFLGAERLSCRSSMHWLRDRRRLDGPR